MRKQKSLQQSTSQPTGQWTIDPDLIEQEILKKAGAHSNAIQRVVLAGMKLLFSPETHDKLFNSINRSVPIEDALGSSAVHIMMLLMNQAKNMPGEAVIPAGTILLARAIDFIHKTNMFPVTDQTFYDALQMFIAVMKRESEKAQQSQPPQPGAAPQPTDTQSPPQAPAGQPQTGMLQQGG